MSLEYRHRHGPMQLQLHGELRAQRAKPLCRTALQRWGKVAL